MAIGADFDAQHIAFDRRARGETVPTGTVDGNGVIIGMNTGLHESPFCRGRSAPLPEVSGNTAASLGREVTSYYNARGKIRQIGKSGKKAIRVVMFRNLRFKVGIRSSVAAEI